MNFKVGDKVMFKSEDKLDYDANICLSYNLFHSKFHRKNIGKIFTVKKIMGSSIILEKMPLGYEDYSFIKGRFDKAIITLPQELFTM